MHSIRRPPLLALLAIALLAAASSSTRAQTDLPAGATLETLETIQVESASGTTWQLYELTLNPGVALTIDAQSGPGMLAVASGELTEVVTGPGAAFVYARDLESAAAEPGKTYTLEPGDTIAYISGIMQQTVQNHGPGFLVLVVSMYSEGGPGGLAIGQTTLPLRLTGKNCNCR